MTPIILLSGPARAGKDTAAKALCERFKGNAIAFADPIKAFMRLAYGLTEAQLYGAEKEVPFGFEFVRRGNLQLLDALEDALPLIDLREFSTLTPNTLFKWQQDHVADVATPRHLLQSFGTECIRKAAMLPNLWLEYGLLRAKTEILDGANLIVFTDGRFRNEILGGKAIGGLTGRIVRPEAQVGMTEAAKGHASETEQASVPDWWFDFVIHNDGSLLDFQSKVCGAAQDRLDLRGSFR